MLGEHYKKIVADTAGLDALLVAYSDEKNRWFRRERNHLYEVKMIIRTN